MTTSPAPRPLLRSYYLPAPTAGPRQAAAKVILALLPIAASALWALSTLRGPTATTPARPTVEQPGVPGTEQADPRLAEPAPAELAAREVATVDTAAVASTAATTRAVPSERIKVINGEPYVERDVAPTRAEVGISIH